MKIHIKEHRKAKGWTQADLAEAVLLSQSYIAAIESQNIDKSPSMDTLVAIANALSVRVGDLFDDHKSIPVLGRVGAGAEVNLAAFDAHPGGLYQISCPDNLYAMRDEVTAVEIEGDSMLPNYQPSDILFYKHKANSVPSEVIGRICVCHDADDNVWVKVVKIGSEKGLFNLLSLNPLADNRLDIKLKWAAPVILHWPKELVERA